MTFDDYWDSRAKSDKWNGKIDLRDFAKSVWNDATGIPQIESEIACIMCEMTVYRNADAPTVKRWILFQLNEKIQKLRKQLRAKKQGKSP